MSPAKTPSRERPPRWHIGAWRALGVVAACAAAATGALLGLLHLLPKLQLLNLRLVEFAVVIPLSAICWVLALVLLAASAPGRTRLVALLTLPGMVLGVLWTRHYWPGETEATGEPVGSVLTFNARCDSIGQDALLGTLAEHRPDIVIIQGAGDRLRTQLEDDPALAPYRHRHVVARMANLPTCGTAIYSRLPVTELTTGAAPPVLRVETGAGPVALVPVDVPGPQDGLRQWDAAIAQVGAAAEAAGRAGLPVIVAGDFNAVPEHAPLRRLRNAGLESAAEQAGAGWVPTYPSDRRYPPFLAIDHVLLGPGLATTELASLDLDGAAHRALLANIVATG